MATTYRQTDTFGQEDGYGAVSIVVTVSDTLAGLYATTATATKIFRLVSVQKALANNSGATTGGVEQEMDFELDESAEMLTADDIAAAAFVKDAIDATILRYCAVFINPHSPIVISTDMLFQGIIQPKMQGDDIKWTAPHWGTTTGASVHWKIITQPYQSAVLNQLVLESYDSSNHLIGGLFHTMDVDTTWKSAHVGDVQSYDDHVAGGSTTLSKLSNVVSLNAVLRRIADAAQAELVVLGLDAITINYDRSILDGKFFPVRWRRRTDMPEMLIMKNNAATFNEATTFYDDDGVQLAIDPDGTPTQYESIYINYTYFVPPTTDGYFSAAMQQSFRVGNSWKNYVDLINGIAIAFGCYANFYWLDSTHLHIKFIPHSAIAALAQVYTRNPEKAQRTITTYALSNNTTQYYGKATPLSDEGYHVYTFTVDSGNGVTPSANTDIVAFQVNNTRAIPVPLTTAQSLALQNRTSQSKTLIMFSFADTAVLLTGKNFIGTGTNQLGMPHNTYLTVNGVLDPAPGVNTTCTDSGIYLYVKNYTIANGYAANDPSYLSCPANYYAPVGRLGLNVNGNDYFYWKLADYLNSLYQFDASYYDIQYDMDIPYWMGFSLSSAGTSPSWQNVDIGSQILLDGVAFTVVKIKRDLTKPLTSLTLHATTRFHFSSTLSSASPASPGITQLPSGAINQLSVINTSDRTASGTIAAFTCVSLNTDGTVSSSRANSTDYNKIYGIALTGVSSGAIVTIQISGVVQNSGWSFTGIGNWAYLRTGTMNIVDSSSILTSNTGAENMVVRVALIKASDTIEILQGFPFQEVLT